MPASLGPTRRRIPGLAGAAVVLLILGVLAFAFLRNGRIDNLPLPGRPAFAAPAAVTYTGPVRQGNGADIHASRANSAPTIDGKLDDWSGAPSWAAANVVSDPGKLTAPKNSADLSAGFLLGYDNANFYLGAVVTDDVHVQNKLTRDFELWKGDDIELWFDTDLPGDFKIDPGNADDYQMGFSPGDFAGFAPQAVFFRPSLLDALKSGVKVAAVPRADSHGYTLEAAVPWTALHLQPPAPGSAVGFCASVGDNDTVGAADQQHMVSTCTRMQWNVPTTFGNLFW